MSPESFPFALHRVTALIGPYGSGKSELSLGLARIAAAQLRDSKGPLTRVALGDIDVLKPYFRSREIGMKLRDEHISLIAPQGALANSDLPILAPELRGTIGRKDTLIILDVGGDPVGARALGSISDVVSEADHELLLVLNRHRPFMDSLDKVLAQAAQIEGAAQLKIGGVVSNTHMMDETVPDDVLQGLDLSREVGARLGIPLRLYAVPEHLEHHDFGPGLPPRVAIRRQMLPNFLGGVVLSPSTEMK